MLLELLSAYLYSAGKCENGKPSGGELSVPLLLRSAPCCVVLFHAVSPRSPFPFFFCAGRLVLK